MTASRLRSLSIHLLRTFATAAEENNISRAAQWLFISQPLLIHHIRHLEVQLGVTLFQHHSKGLILTGAGREILEIIRPPLVLQEHTLAALSQLPAHLPQPLCLGLTTAFEQGVFAAVESTLSDHTHTLCITRRTSPALAQQVRRGKFDAALVALPLNTEELHLHPLPYQGPSIMALPAPWLETATPVLTLRVFNRRPLFWFKRERSPDLFDYIRRIFGQTGYTPVCVGEPAEHDALLARIARSEGTIPLPTSFSAIQRQGVVFCPAAEGDSILLNLGVVYVLHQAESIQQWFSLLDDHLMTGQSQAEHCATPYRLQSKLFRLAKRRKMSSFHFRGLLLTLHTDFSIDTHVLFYRSCIWTPKRIEVCNITATTCD